jgi:hypothetical protein
MVFTHQGELVYLHDATGKTVPLPEDAGRRFVEVLKTANGLDTEGRVNQFLVGGTGGLIAEGPSLNFLATTRGEPTKSARKWLDEIAAYVEATVDGRLPP